MWVSRKKYIFTLPWKKEYFLKTLKTTFCVKLFRFKINFPFFYFNIKFQLLFKGSISVSFQWVFCPITAFRPSKCLNITFYLINYNYLSFKKSSAVKHETKSRLLLTYDVASAIDQIDLFAHAHLILHILLSSQKWRNPPKNLSSFSNHLSLEHRTQQSWTQQKSPQVQLQLRKDRVQRVLFLYLRDENKIIAKLLLLSSSLLRCAIWLRSHSAWSRTTSWCVLPVSWSCCYLLSFCSWSVCWVSLSTRTELPGSRPDSLRDSILIVVMVTVREWVELAGFFRIFC